MTSRERLLTAINNKVPDRLPVTTHHLMPYFLNKYLGDRSNDEFFDYFGMDAIRWIDANKPDEKQGQFYADKDRCGYEGIVSENWHVEVEEIPDKSYKTERYRIITPERELSTVLQHNECTSWVKEHLLKEKRDIELIANYAPPYICDVDKVKRQAEEIGERGILRGSVPGFDIYGQPGCWQDAACLWGIENLIMCTFDDSHWVHDLLKILQQRKLTYILSMKSAPFDLIELGGGDASTTVISPTIFQDFVAPYDSEIITAAHESGQRIVYHTCGGMMPILEDIADMQTDAMETFTPPAMGGDSDLEMAKKRIGHRVCMIGGFDQNRFFMHASEKDVRAEVRRCFQTAGNDGGFILSPSDHFFDGKIELIRAFAEEAFLCLY